MITSDSSSSSSSSDGGDGGFFGLPLATPRFFCFFGSGHGGGISLPCTIRDDGLFVDDHDIRDLMFTRCFMRFFLVFEVGPAGPGIEEVRPVRRVPEYY